ncbi:MAG TPA: MBL fold metallo-hydrolase [Burkholderiaceae bacterium]|nr:MBL fold metallo-hydrolase [Burkholderiaceae bacterium]
MTRRKRSVWRILGWTAIALVAVVAVATPLVLSLPQFGGELSGQRLERARRDPHYRDGRFVNPLPPAPYTWGYMRELIAGQFAGSEARVPPQPLPRVSVTAASLQAPSTGAAGSSPPQRLRAFWIGHASVCIELDGVRLLVDPMFSDYASPFDFGPRRFDPPPIALADLPPIDAVLITHDHYDHLDMRTVQHLARSERTAFIVPLGIGAHLERWGVAPQRIVELQWGQEHPVGGVRIVSTPARHYSGRRFGDRNATLWTSWSLLGARHRVYVSGDTGYSDHFQAIGENFGPFDLAFVKIGAYGPGAPWLDIHMSAEDAVRAVREVGARRMFPLHWGTFNLAFHAWDEPIKRTLAAARASGVEVVTPRLGEIVDADAAFSSTAWWESVR